MIKKNKFLRGAEEREIIIRIYCMEKDYFQFKKKRKEKIHLEKVYIQFEILRSESVI